MTFIDDLDMASVGIARQAKRRAKRVALKAFEEINNESPVDNGTFRANWNVSIDTIDRSVDMEKDKKDYAENTTKATAVIMGQALMGKTVYISNSVPYATKLENGYSPQAPAGIVEPVVTRIKNAMATGQL